MNAQCFYSAQMLAIEISGCSYRTGLEDLYFSPVEQQHLLSGEEQVYDSPYAIPFASDLKLSDHLITLANRITDEARALRRGGRHIEPEPIGELEKIYAEIEGLDCQPPMAPSSGGLSQLHGWLDLLQDVESLHHIVLMYPEISTFEERDRWQERFIQLRQMLEEFEVVCPDSKSEE